MDLTCLNNFPPLPAVPDTANNSITPFTHSSYKPGSGGISQMISASLARSTFSFADLRTSLEKVFKSNAMPGSVSEVVKIAPVTSVITYTSIAIGSVLLLSIIFYVSSCLNFSKRKQRRPQKSKMTTICVCLLVIVYLLGIGDMIYVAYRVSRSTSSIDETIKGVNREIYPKEISEHMTYLIQQIQRLDQYSVQPSSILINASKSMLVRAFNRVLKENYFVGDLIQAMNSIDQHSRDLNKTIDEERSKIPPIAFNTFDSIQTQYNNMLNSIEKPLKEVCDYANRPGTDIDQILLDALKIVHLELKKAIDLINNDILTKLTPWENHMLLKGDVEEQIGGYIRLVGSIFLALVIVLGGIPLLFFTFIFISRLCKRRSNQKKSNAMPMRTMNRPSTSTSRDNFDADHVNNSCDTWLCLMRVAFIVMILMLIALMLLTGVYYTFDLTVQGACRSVHDDQPLLVSFGIDQFFGSDVSFANRSELNAIAMDLINDCRDEVHFSQKLLDRFWSILNDDLANMMNTLNKQISDQFGKAIGTIDIPQDINLFLQFVSQAANVPNISLIVTAINSDLRVVNTILVTISNSNATLSPSLVQTTIAEFRDYVKNVTESTIDKCPLPLSTISKADRLVCHSLGGSISGLWLDVFVFSFLVTVGLCIFGVLVYKRPDQPTEPLPKNSNYF